MAYLVYLVWLGWKAAYLKKPDRPDEPERSVRSLMKKTYLIVPFYTTDWWFVAAGRKAEVKVKVKQGGGWGREEFWVLS